MGAKFLPCCTPTVYGTGDDVSFPSLMLTLALV